MAVAYNFAGPRIVDDGLVLYLDAANPNSYNPSTPLTWRDISRNGNNGTLVNGVEYSSANGGSLVFDGVNDYVNAGSASALFPGPVITGTLCFWCKPSSSASGDNIFIGMQNPSGHRLYVGRISNLWDVGFGDYFWNGGFTGTRIAATLNWTYLCLVITSGSAVLYVNGVKTITKTTDTTVSLTGIFPIGAYFFTGSIGAGNIGPSSIAQVSIYNRALSQAEITQNFNATRGRFGI